MDREPDAESDSNLDAESRNAAVDPLAQARHLTLRLQDIRERFREDIDKVEDPRAQTLFQTSADVLGGLIKALNDFQTKNDSAWRRQ
jgi:hypothetical protein